MSFTAAQVAGAQMSAYDTLYRDADPTQKGYVAANEAARFLKKSNLSNPLLGKIWDLADSKKVGFLDRDAFFVALKLVAAVQAGVEPSPAALSMDLPVPRFVPVPDSPSTPMFASAFADDDWAVQGVEKSKYDAIFDSLGPVDGKLPGDKVRPILLNSGLPTNVLGKIWDLADIDKDGFLDREEMCVALHLVYRALENEPVPPALPRSLVPVSKRGGTGRRVSEMTGAVRVLPPTAGGPRSRAASITSLDSGGSAGFGASMTVPSAAPPSAFDHSPKIGRNTSRSLTSTPLIESSGHMVKPPSAVGWPVDKRRWEAAFLAADTDHDGLVSGVDVREAFLRTGLAQNYLAHIWGLCDVKQNGMLNQEQFALAMHLIEQKRENGIEPPPSLPSELIPPSFRPSPAGMTDMSTSTAAVDLLGSPPSGLPPPQLIHTGNKEIDDAAAENQLLAKEKLKLESNIVQLEADLTVKNSEIKNLEVELANLRTSVDQLDKQQGEATKRLDTLHSQKGTLQSTLDGILEKIAAEQTEVNSLREQLQKQMVTAQSEEREVVAKKEQLSKLTAEENRLQQAVSSKQVKLEHAGRRLDLIDQQIAEVKPTIAKIEEYTRKVLEKQAALQAIIDSGDMSALDADPSLLSDDLSMSAKSSMLAKHASKPAVHSAAPSAFGRATTAPKWNERPDAQTPQTPPGFSMTKSVEDPFKSSDPFSNAAPVGGDPFAPAADPFHGGAAPGFGGDPFGSGATRPDPFGSSSNDPFAPKPAGGASGPPARPGPPVVPPQPNTARSPEGGGKKPPPRPAPPKGRPVTPRSGVTTPAAEDPWGDAGAAPAPAPAAAAPGGDPFASSGGGGFANFADFSKFA